MHWSCAACRRSLFVAPRDRRRRAGLRSRRPGARDRARPGARALRCARAAGRRVRHGSPRPPAECRPARVTRRRRRRAHHRGGCVGRLADGRPPGRRRGRPRRHRRPAGRRGSSGGSRSPAPATADPARAPGRESPERRDGARRLPHRGRGRRRCGHAPRCGADRRAHGGGKPARGLGPRPAVPDRNRTRARRRELHGAHVRRDARRLAPRRAPQPVADHHHGGLRHDALAASIVPRGRHAAGSARTRSGRRPCSY